MQVCESWQSTPFVSQLLDREQQEQQDLSAARQLQTRTCRRQNVESLPLASMIFFMLFIVVGTSDAIGTFEQ
jgi:hypothetical protein